MNRRKPKVQRADVTTRMPLSKCRECGYAMDASSGAFDNTAVPTPGDFSLCINCGHVGVFTEQMTIRSATLLEMNNAPDETLRIVKLIAMRGLIYPRKTP